MFGSQGVGVECRGTGRMIHDRGGEWIHGSPQREAQYLLQVLIQAGRVCWAGSAASQTPSKLLALGDLYLLGIPSESQSAGSASSPEPSDFLVFKAACPTGQLWPVPAHPTSWRNISQPACSLSLSYIHTHSHCCSDTSRPLGRGEDMLTALAHVLPQ